MNGVADLEMAKAAVMRLDPDGAWKSRILAPSGLWERGISAAIALGLAEGQEAGGARAWRLTGRGKDVRSAMDAEAAKARPPEPVRRMLISGAEVERRLPNLGQRERASLGAMAKSGKIGAADLIAANRFARTYIAAAFGVFDKTKSGTAPGPVLRSQEAMVGILKQDREACAVLGAAGVRRMVSLLVEGMSISALSQSVGQSHECTGGMVVADLGRLVEHYAETDASRKRLH